MQRLSGGNRLDVSEEPSGSTGAAGVVSRGAGEVGDQTSLRLGTKR